MDYRVTDVQLSLLTVELPSQPIGGVCSACAGCRWARILYENKLLCGICFRKIQKEVLSAARKNKLRARRKP